MKARGRPILGAISGLFFGFFLGLELVFFKAMPMSMITTAVLPAAGLVLGMVLGIAGPFGKDKVEPNPEPSAEEMA